MVVLGEWLGLEYTMESGSSDWLQITCIEDAAHRKLELNDAFFSTPAKDWMTSASLPADVRFWNCDLFGVPDNLAVLYGGKLSNGDYVLAEPGLVRMGVDVFGIAFFMLTRYEELINPKQDELDRFASRFSVIHHVGLLERPIVNELLELLWWALHRLWPNLIRKRQAYKCLLSCDFDNVEVMGTSLFRALRIAVGRPVREALRDGLWRKALTGSCRLWQAWSGKPGMDALDDFDFLMDQAEQHQCKFVFNFISGHGRSGKDGIYDIHQRGIRTLMRRINEREHELGYHGSFDSFRNPLRVQQEFRRLTQIAAEEGVTQEKWGGRQHYLRWNVPITWQSYEDAGLAYDSTLGYADHVGFRCGTCYEFPVFNLQTRRALKLRERPLICMDASMLGKSYMNLDKLQSLKKVEDLAKSCQKFCGQFSLLWHNGQMKTVERRELLVGCLNAVGAPNTLGF